MAITSSTSVGTKGLIPGQQLFKEIQTQEAENRIKIAEQYCGALEESAEKAEQCFQEFLEHTKRVVTLIGDNNLFVSAEAYRLNNPQRAQDDLALLNRQDRAFRKFYKGSSNFVNGLGDKNREIMKLDKEIRSKGQTLHDQTNMHYHIVQNGGKPWGSLSSWRMPSTFPLPGSESASSSCSSSSASSSTSSDSTSSSISVPGSEKNTTS
jgi:hypothetical protein